MKLGKTRNKVSTEFNMSSMTDIVFLLLIFFMLTSTMVTTNALDLVLPKAKGKTDSNKSTAINVTNDLKFYIDKSEVSKDDLEKKLMSIMAEKNENDRKIIIRAEENVPYKDVVFIMDIGNRNKLKMTTAVSPK